MWDASTAHAEHSTTLGAGGNFDRFVALQRGHRDLGPKRGLGHVDLKLHQDVVLATLEHRVRLYVEDDIEVALVPGSFEIPVIAKKLAQSKKYDAVICLAAVIRGGTPHFEYISAEVTKGIAQINLGTGIPVIYGVITTDTLEQAIERSGTKSGNKGFEAAVSAIEMANLVKSIGQS